MSAALIKTIIEHLPRYAEEEGDFYSVSRLDLIDALCINSIDESVAVNTVELLEVLLNSLSVLNRDYLDKGEWCFVSFPAQLMALSVLTAMSEHSRFFEPRFWNTQGIDDHKKEEQRKVLNYLESARFNLNEAVKPIRFIYVAWAIIKSDAGILFHQREDVKKRFDKLSGDYGLLGGRLNQADINGFKAVNLKCLQSNNVNFNQAALENTLKRELKEEAGLIFETHYDFKLWRRLKPYQQVEGAAPNHGLTEYYFDIFVVNLNLAGFLFLEQHVKSNQRLVWISIDDVVNEESNGRRLFIKSLLNDYETKAFLKSDLLALKNSFVSPYLVNKNKYGLTLLKNTDKPLCAGVLGKEKVLNLCLTPEQQGLLLALAAHNRGFEFVELAQAVILHPDGWLEVQKSSLQAALMALAAVLKSTDFVIESEQECFFRLSVEPTLLYFDAKLFCLTLVQTDLDSRKTKIPVTITRTAIETALGLIASETVSFEITRRLARDLYKLSLNTAEKEALAIEDNYKKARESGFAMVGLKSLLCRDSGKIRFCANYKIIESAPK